ncbi:MAG: electron transport complex subunit RsxC [Candidatus Nitricoxidivorans perseverans]|uniref:Ion-translocating oxidoreductase complex subunit C n=1 Tax=Candidatus Nitricoxidivorans perseverans TaxID=2975601 RepID=A0AA49FLW0_9PROT|nr:MAG: electron transport complex subunit RsxC [Candidatus Nitricoxidivorans perseverans]
MKLFRFHGGIKPAYHKEPSTTQPIGVAPLPAELVIPLHQSIGGVPRPLVKAGETVKKGQLVGAPDGFVSSAVHASTSGTVKAVEMRLMPHTSGLSALCVVIEPDGRDEWIEHGPVPWRSLPPDEVRDILRDAGVVGLGGAVFPSYLKVNPGKQGKLDTLVINGAECEPFITCDDMQMRERGEAIVRGAALLRDLTKAGQVLIGIEDNKPEAVTAMRAAVEKTGEARIEVVPVPTRYPAGGAKQLIRVLTGIEVPHGKRSTDYGVQCFNTGTAFAIYEALALGQPLVSRIVTVAGNVDRPRNFEVRIGTPMKDVIAMCGPKPDTDRLIMGGPMMGFRMPADAVPVVKAANCILVGSKALFPPPPPEMPCIRCGECAKVCPSDLQPFEMYWFSRAKIFGKAQEYHLFDCIECGCCAYVCPSRIPLVDYYRFAKSEIWAREREKADADTARGRYEFRLAREEREKQEKAARLAAKAAETKAKLAQQQAEADGGKVSAGETADVDKQAMIAAAVARAQAQKGG